MEDVRKNIIGLCNELDEAEFEIVRAKRELEELEINLKDKEKNTIKDVENFKRELKRDGLYSEKLADFLECYMKYYNT